MAIRFISAVNLLADGKGVQQAVLAGGSLAGYHRADHGAGTAGDKALPGDICLERLDLVIGNALDLNGQPGGKGDGSVSKFFRGLGNAPLLGGGDLAVDSDDPSGEVVCALVGQEAHCLYPLFVCCADGQCRHSRFLLCIFLFEIEWICFFRSAAGRFYSSSPSISVNVTPPSRTLVLV